MGASKYRGGHFPIVRDIFRDIFRDVEEFGRESLSSIISRTTTDFVAIGDSNQLMNGNGWDHGMQYALSNNHPMYATALISAAENGGAGAGAGYKYNNSGRLGVSGGAPAEVDKYMNKGSGNLFPLDYDYRATGTITASAAHGLVVDADCPVYDCEGRMRAELVYATFDNGSGSIYPMTRLNVSPYTWLHNNSRQDTNTGTYGTTSISHAISVSNKYKELNTRWAYSNQTVTGPWLGYYMRMRADYQTFGFSYHTLNGRGGESTRVVATDLQQFSDESLTLYFSTIRESQQSEKAVVITVCEGLNDRNDTNISVGGGGYDSSTPEGFVDNHKAIVDRVKAIWTLNGWDQSELKWFFMPSHPVSTPDDSDLVSYRAALKTYSESLSNAYFVDISDLISADDMLAAGYYQSGGADRNHLTQEGYENIGQLITNAI